MDFIEANSDTFLRGTASSVDKMQEPEMIDRYIREGAQEKGDYEVINQELWEFLHLKYGYDFEVRRYWQKG